MDILSPAVSDSPKVGERSRGNSLMEKRKKTELLKAISINKKKKFCHKVHSTVRSFDIYGQQV